MLTPVLHLVMTLGLLLTSFVLGLRHGIDWDHIAAIADLSGTAETRRRGFALSMLYAVGHGAVVFALGAAAIFAGASIPTSVDAWMGRVVGLTLVALGFWILVELARKGRSFRLRSRWILIISGTFAGLRRVRSSTSNRHVAVEHDHDHEHVDHDDASHTSTLAHDHAHVAETAEIAELAPLQSGTGIPSQPSNSLDVQTDRHTHRHGHRLALPDDPSARYGNGTATGIGMLHGVGIESPTQIALFVASTSVAGASVGLLLLAGWIAGLIIANAALALLAGFGLLHAERSFGIYATLVVIVGVMSIAMGTLFALGI